MMLGLSSLHHLFHTDTCVASMQTRRWKDRSLHCPRCHSHTVGPWRMYHDRPGLKCYRCKGCRRTFNDLTQTLFARSQQSLAHGILATFLVGLSCSSRCIARELGVHIHTSSRWCWWLRYAALSYEQDRQWTGIVEADALSHTAGQKGHAQPGGKKALGRRARRHRKKHEPRRGHDDKDRQRSSPR
jgi:transposase-like protein